MQTRTISSGGYAVTITAKRTIPPSLLRRMREAIKEDQDESWKDVKRELENELGENVDNPANRLMAYRSSQGISQKKLAELSGVSQGRISEMEKGKKGIGVSQARKLARILEIDYKRLL